MSRGKPDYYTKKAKANSYPARSVYKLEEIQNKYSFLKPGYKVLDIGAAPGSWSMFAAKCLKGKGTIVSVDLKPLEISGPGFEIIRQYTDDAFSQEMQRVYAQEGPFDVLISDAAPSTTGNRTVDAARSCGLVEQVLYTAALFVKPGGFLVVKIFQGGDIQELIKLARKLFVKTKLVKPKASRSQSFETFLTGFELIEDAQSVF